MLALGLLCVSWRAHGDTVASLLGNFTVNQFAGVKVGKQHVHVHFVVVMGQVPALKALHKADKNHDGVTSQAERDAYLKHLAPSFARNLIVRANDQRVALHLASLDTSLPSEATGFSLRLDARYAGKLPSPVHGYVAHLHFHNANYLNRIGWHEVVVKPVAGIHIFNTNAVSTSMTQGLSVNPEKLPPGGPLNERSVHMAFTVGPVPAGAAMLHARKGYPAAARTQVVSGPGTNKQKQGWLGWLSQHFILGATSMSNTASTGTAGTWLTRSTKELMDMISPEHTPAPGVALLALLVALMLGAVHAFSPGHGKTVVGAYLVGSRGTPRHAAFLGLTVTITHTAGVFALGFAAIVASQYIVPGKLFPILSLVSGLLVVVIGATLLVNRLRAMRGQGDEHAHHHHHSFELNQDHFNGMADGLESGHTHHHHLDHHAHEGVHSHAHFASQDPEFVVTASDAVPTHEHLGAHGEIWHSHGGKMHSHLPPGAAGERITWKSLLALGISGGLVPCPSAMVILLAAIAIHRTAFGMILVVAFSIGLAAALTAVGMVFLYARHLFRRRSLLSGRLVQILPMLSAGLITGIGVLMCYTVIATVGIGL
jgi:ABC-type nickel/cobalt efflux system permease component RcnA